MKSGKFLLLAGMALFWLTGCISIPIGDGNKLKISSDGITVIDSENEEHKIEYDEAEGEITVEGFGQEEGESRKISIDEESGTVTFEGENEEGSYTATFGEGGSLPDHFPKEVPLANDANIVMQTSTDQAHYVMYVTKESFASVANMYEDYAKKYTTGGEPTINDMNVEIDGAKITSKQIEVATEHGNVILMVVEDPTRNEGVQVTISIE